MTLKVRFVARFAALPVFSGALAVAALIAIFPSMGVAAERYYPDDADV
jgi:hypothetical protein